MDASPSTGRPRSLRRQPASRRPWHPTPRTPLPASLTDDEIVQLVNEGPRAGQRRNARVERNLVTVWRTLYRLARADRSGHIATSRQQLVKALCGPDGIPGWADYRDPEQNELHHGRSLTRWLDLLVAAGLVESAGGVRRADGSWWRTEVVLRDRARIAAAFPGSSIGRAFGC